MRKSCGKNVLSTGMGSTLLCTPQWIGSLSFQGMWEDYMFSTSLRTSSPHPLPQTNQPHKPLSAAVLSTVSTAPIITGANKEKKGYNR